METQKVILLNIFEDLYASKNEKMSIKLKSRVEEILIPNEFTNLLLNVVLQFDT